MLAAIAAVAVTQTSLGDTLLGNLSIGGKSLGTETLCYSVGRSDYNEDVYALRMQIVRGDTVSGELALIPFEQPLRAGEFRGAVLEKNPASGLWTADLVWTALDGGVVRQEELRIQFNRDAALIGMGVKEQAEDGRFVYANPDQILYSLAVPASSCSGSGSER